VSPLHNRTRTSESIPRKLLREGKLHLLPVYALMRTSDLAREGIENSGSYRFADHVYRNEASGRFGIGRALDAVLLRMRGARSMRSRFQHSQNEILAAARAFAARTAKADATAFRVLSIPCGIARDLALVATRIRRELPDVYARSTFFGVDLDPTRSSCHASSPRRMATSSSREATPSTRTRFHRISTSSSRPGSANSSTTSCSCNSTDTATSDFASVVSSSRRACRPTAWRTI
jgi:hypothetical protein